VLANVSAAVMACTEPTHYDNVPKGFNVPWGQGPALLAPVEQLGHDWQE
jgi:unsaturated rhamnogalacturonyl hydrolase